MTQDEAIAKVRKLLALAQSDNPNEAASAAAAAQGIMDRYQLESAMLEISDPAAQPAEDTKGFHEPLNPEDKRKSATWKWRLAFSIAQVNGCKVYSEGPAIKIIGKPSDASAVRYLFAYLTDTIDKMARKACAGEGRTYANNWRIGCVETVGRRLDEQHRLFKVQQLEAAKSAPNSETALVLVSRGLQKLEERRGLAETWAAQHLKLRHVSGGGGARYDDGGRAAGRAAGHTIPLNRARGALPS